MSVNYSSRAFWSDVLTSQYHGFSDDYTLANVSVGRKWRGNRYTTSAKVTNLLHENVQPHIFGDIVKRSVMGELKVTY